jgi:hypothetical protein
MANSSTTTFPATLDVLQENPSNVDRTEAGVIAMQTKSGVRRLAAADGAITPAAGEVFLTKAGVNAMTLAAPSTALNGARLVIMSTTANAHTVTATDLIHDGVTGGAKDLATFGAFPGASLELMAYAGAWYVVSKNVVTITAV